VAYSASKKIHLDRKLKDFFQALMANTLEALKKMAACETDLLTLIKSILRAAYRSGASG
jgi:hypothetical protein